MAAFSLYCIAALFLYVAHESNLCASFNPRIFNVSETQLDDSGWSSARSSWYGHRYGAGSDGGACGYQKDVSAPPYSSMITAAAPSVFMSGSGCGTCYQVKCTTNPVCSGNPVTVVITDECPGCGSQSLLFDMSGTSFGSMSSSGKEDQLKNVGIQEIQYQRVPCRFNGVPVTFKVDAGSNSNYFAVLIEYVNGYGFTGVELKQGGAWLPMQKSWGAVWRLNSGSSLEEPFSIRLTAGDGNSIVADNVIPAGYEPGNTYISNVNF